MPHLTGPRFLAQPSEGEGINIDAAWVQEAFDHSEIYGHLTAKGQRRGVAGRIIAWNKKIPALDCAGQRGSRHQRG